MRIGIDVTSLLNQYSNHDIGVYTRELTQNLINQESDHIWVLFGYNSQKENYSLLNLKKTNHIEFVSLGRSRKSNIFNPLYFTFSYKNKIKKSKLDMYFVPNFEMGLPKKHITTIVAIHNVLPYITGKYSANGSLVNFIQKLFYKNNLNKAKKADLILTSSRFTKRELVHKAKFDENKVAVTHHAVSQKFENKKISQSIREIRRVLVMYKIAKPYILSYSDLDKNKNIPNLLHAFSKVSNRYPALKLILSSPEFVVGWNNKPSPKTKEASEILDLITDLKLKHKVIIVGDIESRHLPIIMNNAKMFISLSTYENFGKSVLEAISAGTPVIASKRSCYPELLANSAKFVAPYNIDKVSEVILDLLQEDQNLTKQINLGYKTSKQYTWEATAIATLKQFNEFKPKLPKLKIAHLIPHFQQTNSFISNSCYNLAKEMKREGHNVSIFTTLISKNNSFKNSNSINKSQKDLLDDTEQVDIKYYKKINKQYRLGFYPSMLLPILSNHFDVIHVHGLGFVWQDIMLILKKLFSPKTKIINTPYEPFMGGDNYSLLKKLLKRIYIALQKLFLNSIYTQIIQINPFQVNWLNTYKIKKRKVIYLANGLDTNFFETSNPTTKSEMLKLGRKLVITTTTDLDNNNGIKYLIEALPDVIEYKNNIILIIIINTLQHNKNIEIIENLISDLTLEKKVTILKMPKQATIQYILQQSDIFVTTNKYNHSGVDILHAAAKENAIITTRTEGGKFLIKEDENGYLYDYADIQALSNLLIDFGKDKNLLTKMQKENTKKAKKFTWNEIAKNYSKLIREITRK